MPAHLLTPADPRYCLDTDQNGSHDPLGAACDIGAIEATSDVAAAAAPALLECSLHDRILAAIPIAPWVAARPGTDHDIIQISEDIKLREVLPAIPGAITIEGGGHIISGNNHFAYLKFMAETSPSNNLILANGQPHLMAARSICTVARRSPSTIPSSTTTFLNGRRD